MSGKNEGYIKIYSPAYYKSFERFLKKNGFGNLPKKNGKLLIKYLPLKYKSIHQFKKIDESDDNHFFEHKKTRLRRQQIKVFHKDFESGRQTNKC